MTTHRNKRCAVCQSSYLYQASGHGCGEALNDATYCPSCKQVILTALKDVRVKFECRYVSVLEVPAYAGVTIEDIRRWEEDLLEMVKINPPSFPIVTRIWPALYDLKSGDRQSIYQVIATSGPHKGVSFQVSKWTVRPDVEIKVPMEWDVVNARYTGLWR